MKHKYLIKIVLIFAAVLFVVIEWLICRYVLSTYKDEYDMKILCANIYSYTCINLQLTSGLIGLVLITAKRCDFFSVFAPFYIIIPGTVCTLAVMGVIHLGDSKGFFMLFCVEAGQHLIFSIQYLRSSLTVPLYFDRREKIESNCEEKVKQIDKKTQLISCITIVVQFQILYVDCWIFVVLGVDKLKESDAVFDSILILTLVLYAASMTILIVSGWLIYRWKF